MFIEICMRCRSQKDIIYIGLFSYNIQWSFNLVLSDCQHFVLFTCQPLNNKLSPSER